MTKGRDFTRWQKVKAVLNDSDRLAECVKKALIEFGIFDQIGNEYIPTGFNAWRECDGELAIGKLTEMDTFRVEGTDKVMRGVDAPVGFWECEDPGANVPLKHPR
jgi:hypothetical protein